MTTTELTLENFDLTINSSETVVLDFWAPWCGPCKMFAPIYESVSKQNPNIIFGKINTEEQSALAARFGIRSIPTLAIFRDQIMIFSQPGVMPEAGLIDLIEQAGALDMDQVRAQLAEENSSKSATV
jgi:thioredoxin